MRRHGCPNVLVRSANHDENLSPDGQCRATRESDDKEELESRQPDSRRAFGQGQAQRQDRRNRDQRRSPDEKPQCRGAVEPRQGCKPSAALCEFAAAVAMAAGRRLLRATTLDA